MIFPIVPYGDDDAPELAAQLTELLSRSLDGAGELRVVDPATVAR